MVSDWFFGGKKKGKPMEVVAEVTGEFKQDPLEVEVPVPDEVADPEVVNEEPVKSGIPSDMTEALADIAEKLVVAPMESRAVSSINVPDPRDEEIARLKEKVKAQDEWIDGLNTHLRQKWIDLGNDRWIRYEDVRGVGLEWEETTDAHTAVFFMEDDREIRATEFQSQEDARAYMRKVLGL